MAEQQNTPRPGGESESVAMLGSAWAALLATERGMAIVDADLENAERFVADVDAMLVARPGLVGACELVRFGAQLANGLHTTTWLVWGSVERNGLGEPLPMTEAQAAEVAWLVLDQHAVHTVAILRLLEARMESAGVGGAAWAGLDAIAAAGPKSLWVTTGPGGGGNPADVLRRRAYLMHRQLSLCLSCGPRVCGPREPCSTEDVLDLDLRAYARVDEVWKLVAYALPMMHKEPTWAEWDAEETALRELMVRLEQDDTPTAPPVAPPVHPAVEVVQRLSGVCREVLLAFVEASELSMKEELVREKVNSGRAERAAEISSVKLDGLTSKLMTRDAVVWHLMGNIRTDNTDGTTRRGKPRPGKKPPEPFIERVPDSNSEYRLTAAARAMRSELAKELRQAVG